MENGIGSFSNGKCKCKWKWCAVANKQVIELSNVNGNEHIDRGDGTKMLVITTMTAKIKQK